MATHTENVIVSVSSNGAVTVKKQIDDIGAAASNSGKNVSAFSGLIAGLFTVGTLATIARYGDQFTQIQNRLKLVTSSTQQLNDVTQALTGIANGTYTSLTSVATVYQRIEQATSSLGVTQQQTLDFTKQFSQAVALSGASAETADQAITQFTQGLGAGVLRGQDLRSVLDGLPGVTAALAVGLKNVGVSASGSIAELRALAEQGKLTPKQIMDAFSSVAPQIASDFAKINPTINQAFQVLDNQLTVFAGKAQGVFSAAARAVIFFADNLEVIVTAATPVIAILTVLAVQTLGTLFVNALASGITSVTRLASAIFVDLIPAFAGLSIAILTNPLTWFAVFVAGLVITIEELVKAFINGTNAWDEFMNDINTGWQLLKQVFGDINSIFEGGTAAAFGGGVKAGGSAGTAIAKGQSASNPNLSDKQVSDNIASSVSASTSAATQQLNAGISGGFATGLDLLNSTQQNSFQSGADTVSKALDTSFTNGAASLGSAITSALPASSSSSAGTSGPSINGTWSDYLASVDAWMNNYVQNNGYNRANKTPQGPSNLDNQTPGSGSFHAFANGGSFRVGGVGGTDSQTVSFRASPNERVTITTPEQEMRMSANGNAPVNVAAPVVNNILDAKNIPLAMDTAVGKTTLVNMMKFNQEEFRRALGVN